jgi:prophage regulatory protein
MTRGRYRTPSAGGNQAPQTSSGDLVSQISSRDQAPKIASSHRLIYYRAVDLAERYQVHVVTIWKWLRSGNLPPSTRLGPNTVAWRSDHIEAWETERSSNEVARLLRKAAP